MRIAREICAWFDSRQICRPTPAKILQNIWLHLAALICATMSSLGGHAFAKSPDFASIVAIEAGNWQLELAAPSEPSRSETTPSAVELKSAPPRLDVGPHPPLPDELFPAAETLDAELSHTGDAEDPTVLPQGPNFKALGNNNVDHSGLSRSARKLEFAYQALNFIDLLQTTYCLERGTCAEKNPIYGSNPNRRVLVVSKLVSGILHYAVTKTLAQQEPELVDEWQIATIAIQGGVVMWNIKFCF